MPSPTDNNAANNVPAAPAPANPAPQSSLPPETIDFAHRIFDAARSGDTTLLDAIDAGLPVNLTNAQGNTLLMLAAYAGHADLTDALIARSADPNRLNDRNQSIVAGAVFKAHDAIVRALINAGADPRLGKPTAIETAHVFGRKDLLELLGAKEGDVGPDVPSPLPGPPGSGVPSS